MIVMKKTRGKIIIAPDLNVWPHEYETAKSLAMAGMTVEFIRRSEEYRTTSADVIIDGAAWEIKACLLYTSALVAPSAARLCAPRRASARNAARLPWPQRTMEKPESLSLIHI